MNRIAKIVYQSLLLAVMLALGLTASPALAEAEPVFTTTVTLHEAAQPTAFNVYATDEALPGHEGEPVYRIQYSRSQGGATTQPLLFPCLDTDALAPMLRFVDLNLDGWLDIEALYAMGPNNIRCTYFICEGESESFYESPILSGLSNYDVYPKQRLILSYEHDSAASGAHMLYRWPEGERLPYLFRVASFLYNEGENGQSMRDKVAEYDPSGAETLLRDEACSPDLSDEEWQARYAERQRLLWQGLDSEEPPLPMALYHNPQGGRYYHSRPDCESISPKYHAGMQILRRSELNETAHEALTPCPICCASEL